MSTSEGYSIKGKEVEFAEFFIKTIKRIAKMRNSHSPPMSSDMENANSGQSQMHGNQPNDRQNFMMSVHASIVSNALWLSLKCGESIDSASFLQMLNSHNIIRAILIDCPQPLVRQAASKVLLDRASKQNNHMDRAQNQIDLMFSTSQLVSVCIHLVTTTPSNAFEMAEFFDLLIALLDHVSLDENRAELLFVDLMNLTERSPSLEVR